MIHYLMLLTKKELFFLWSAHHYSYELPLGEQRLRQIVAGSIIKALVLYVYSIVLTRWQRWRIHIFSKISSSYKTQFLFELDS